MTVFFTVTTTAATSGTFTFAVGKKREPEPPKKEPDPLAGLRRASLPVAMRPTVYGTCPRCAVNLDVEAFGGKCSACGGPLRVG